MVFAIFKLRMEKIFEKLKEISGVLVIGEFTNAGNFLVHCSDVISYEDVPEKIDELIALVHVANHFIDIMKSNRWSIYTEKEGLYPVEGFMLAGGKYVTCIVRSIGVFCEYKNADFDSVFRILFENLIKEV
ncbi:MAG: DUF2173 family protein [Hydrogenobacter sp.]